MRKALSLIAVGVMAAALCGCASTGVAPYDYGVAVGTAAYVGYERVAERQDDEFRARVAELWARVDAIDSAEDLAAQLAAIAADMSTLVDDDRLTDADRAALRALAAMVLNRVEGKVADGAEKHPEAVEFLRGVRDGVDAMRTIAQ